MFDERRIYFLRTYGSQMKASQEMGLHPSVLSTLLHGYRKPSATEEEKLRRALGDNRYNKFFGKRAKVESKKVQLEGQEAVSE